MTEQPQVIHSTSLSIMLQRDWLAMMGHWSMFGGYSFCRKIGRKWTVEGFGFRNTPLFKTKSEAERYATNLILAETRYRKSLQTN